MAEIPGGQFSVFYFSGPSHLILINGEASLFFRRFINLMCARRHFNHKSGILGLENSRRGDSGRDKNKPEVRSRDGAALAGVWGGKHRAGAPPALAGPLGGRYPGLRHPSEGSAAVSSSSRPGWGDARGREREAIQVAARERLGPPPPHSGRAHPRRWRLG